MAKKPCWMRISPVPPQLEHWRGWVPGLAPLPWQVSQRLGRWISMREVAPKAACSRSSSRL